MDKEPKKTTGETLLLPLLYLVYFMGKYCYGAGMDGGGSGGRGNIRVEQPIHRMTEVTEMAV